MVKVDSDWLPARSRTEQSKSLPAVSVSMNTGSQPLVSAESMSEVASS